MLADHAPQKNAGSSTKRLLKDLSFKERGLTIRELALCLTKLGQTDLAYRIIKVT